MTHFPYIIIGAGASGLVIARGLAKAGKEVLLIERGSWGGDCTNYGCIPSKSLIASAKVGGKSAAEALERTRRIVDEVRSHEDATALAKQGIVTLTGTAIFTDPHTLQVGEKRFFGKQIVIATGSSALIPSIQGLDQTPFLTNETIFDLKEIPSTLAIIGAGPIGCELAQAFQRLGSQVTLIHSHRELLNKEETEAQKVIQEQFLKEAITLHLGERPLRVQYKSDRFHIHLEGGQFIESSHLLIAVGRKPNVASLRLEQAHVHYTERGITIDAYGRTSQKHIWAVGDVIGSPFFTHWAEYQARSVLTSLLLPFKKKIANHQNIPRVTFTDPEVASIGLQEKQASKAYTIASYVVALRSVDRAICTGKTEGFIKIVTKKFSSKILGCTIVAPRAGEMLGEISLAMMANIPLRKLAYLIHPYPTYNQAIRKAADLWLTQTILPLFRK